MSKQSEKTKKKETFSLKNTEKSILCFTFNQFFEQPYHILNVICFGFKKTILFGKDLFKH